MKQIKRKFSKAFTLIELVVVIAVIAVLGAVSVAAYMGVISQANRSADEQAVTQMNTILTAQKILDDKLNKTELYEVLSENGLNAEDYSPLVKDRYFFYDSDCNKVFYVEYNRGDKVIDFPSDYAGQTKNTDHTGHSWSSLSGDVQKVKVEVKDGKAEVSSGEALYSIGKDILEGSSNGTSTSNITLTESVDLSGGSFYLNEGTGNASSGLSKDITIGGSETSTVTITGLYNDHGTASTSNSSKTQSTYGSGIFSTIPTGVTVTLKNLIIDGACVGGLDKDTSGLVCGYLYGKLVLDNVTFKNCSVYGKAKVGLLAGQMNSGSIEIKTSLKVENCTIYTSEGECGTLVGYAASGLKGELFTKESKEPTITDTKCVYEHTDGNNGCTYFGLEELKPTSTGDFFEGTYVLFKEGVMNKAKLFNEDKAATIILLNSDTDKDEGYKKISTVKDTAYYIAHSKYTLKDFSDLKAS